MNPLLQELVLSSSGARFEAKLQKLRSEMLEAARLAGPDSEQNRTVVSVLRMLPSEAIRGRGVHAEIRRRGAGAIAIPYCG